MGWIKTGINFVIDQIIEHWPSLVVVSGGVVMSYLASISKALADYGPVAWGGCGILAAAALSLIFWIYGSARLKLGAAAYADKHSNTTSINPLTRRFELQRIKISDFYHPYSPYVRKAWFKDCELFGPAHVAFSECVFGANEYVECDIVILKAGLTTFVGVVLFDGCHLDDCKLFHTTIYMTKAQFDGFKSAANGPLRVISDGTVGNY